MDARQRATVTRNTPLRICFEVYPAHAPALRSLLEDLQNKVGEKLEGAAAFAREQAWTNAAIGMAAVRAAVNAQVPAGDPNYV